MKRIKSCLLIYFLVIAIWISSNCIIAKEKIPENTLYSYGACVMDGENGRVLYGKNENEECPMASTTKIMTLILALEYGNLDDYVTVSSYAAKMPQVRLGLKEGEQYLLSDVLYSMMLESHNDSAMVVAEHIGGSAEHFAVMMNEKARELGLTHTYFITPNGLDAENQEETHHTTAKELAMIMQYCTRISPKKDQFVEICQTRSHSFMDLEKHRSFVVNNKNALLDMIPGVVAGKTGFTGKAGYCYVCAIDQDGKNVIIALLACGWPNHRNYKWQDTKTLLEYVDSNYERKRIVSENMLFKELKIEKGTEKYIYPYIVENYDILLSKWDQIRVEINYQKDFEFPIKEHQVIGTMDVYVNDSLYKCIEIYSDRTVNYTGFHFYLKNLLDCFLL